MYYTISVFATKDGYIEEIMEFDSRLKNSRDLKKVLNRWIKRGYTLTFYDVPSIFVPFILQERKQK